MTQDEIIKLAGHRQVPPWVIKLVADAVAQEREACAVVCEEFGSMPANMSQAWRNGCIECATEIRARGQE